MSVCLERDMAETHTTACEAIVEALEEHESCNFLKTGSTLYDYVNTEALDTLFDHNPSVNLSIEFELEDVTVEVWRKERTVCARVNELQT